MIEAEIYSRIVGETDTPLTYAVVPQGETGLWSTYFVVSETPSSTIPLATSQTVRLQVDTYSTDLEEAQTVATEIESALVGWTSQTILCVRRTQRRTIYEKLTGSDGIRHRVSMDYRLKTDSGTGN